MSEKPSYLVSGAYTGVIVAVVWRSFEDHTLFTDWTTALTIGAGATACLAFFAITFLIRQNIDLLDLCADAITVGQVALADRDEALAGASTIPHNGTINATEKANA